MCDNVVVPSQAFLKAFWKTESKKINKPPISQNPTGLSPPGCGPRGFCHLFLLAKVGCTLKYLLAWKFCARDLFLLCMWCFLFLQPNIRKRKLTSHQSPPKLARCDQALGPQTPSSTRAPWTRFPNKAAKPGQERASGAIICPTNHVKTRQALPGLPGVPGLPRVKDGWNMLEVGTTWNDMEQLRSSQIKVRPQKISADGWRMLRDVDSNDTFACPTQLPSQPTWRKVPGEGQERHASNLCVLWLCLHNYDTLCTSDVHPFHGFTFPRQGNPSACLPLDIPENMGSCCPAPHRHLWWPKPGKSIRDDLHPIIIGMCDAKFVTSGNRKKMKEDERRNPNPCHLHQSPTPAWTCCSCDA